MIVSLATLFVNPRIKVVYGGWWKEKEAAPHCRLLWVIIMSEFDQKNHSLFAVFLQQHNPGSMCFEDRLRRFKSNVATWTFR